MYGNAEWINTFAVKDNIAYCCGHSNGWLD
jgi:hypothetical protein